MNRIEAIDYVRCVAPVGSTIYCVVETARSGATHWIKPYAITGRDYWLGPAVEKICGYRCVPAHGDANVVRGGGMDMAFDLVYHLARAVYGDGYALTARRL